MPEVYLELSHSGQDRTLRRNALAMIGWGAGTGLMSAIGLVVFSAVAVPRGLGWFDALCLGVLVSWTVAWLSGRTELGPTHLVSGNRLFPQRVDRADVIAVEVGRVPWGRAAYVEGIELVLADGSRSAVRLSALLDPATRSEWIKEIEDWATHA